MDLGGGGTSSSKCQPRDWETRNSERSTYHWLIALDTPPQRRKITCEVNLGTPYGTDVGTDTLRETGNAGTRNCGLHRNCWGRGALQKGKTDSIEKKERGEMRP